MVEHAWGDDVHYADVGFAGNRFHPAGILCEVSQDERPGEIRPVGVEDANGYILIDGGNHGGRMNDSRPVKGELRGLLEREGLQGTRILHDPRVSGHDPIYICPDLDFLGAESRAEN